MADKETPRQETARLAGDARPVFNKSTKDGLASVQLSVSGNVAGDVAMVDATGMQLTELAAVVVKKTLIANTFTKLFPIKPVRTTTAAFEVREYVSQMLTPFARGMDGTEIHRDLRDMRNFNTQHYPQHTTIPFDSLQNVREIGTLQPMMPASLINLHMEKAAENVAVVLNFLCSQVLYRQALVIPNPANLPASSQMYDYTSASTSGFGIIGGSTRPAQTATFAVSGGTESIASDIKAARAVVYPLLGNTNWDGSFVALYNPDTAATFLASSWYKEQVKYSGVFAEKLISPPDFDFIIDRCFFNTAYDQFAGSYFIPDNRIIMVPTNKDGTAVAGLTSLAVAPAPFADTVNNEGTLFNVRTIVRPDQKGQDIWATSDFIPVCMRPDLLTIVTVS